MKVLQINAVNKISSTGRTSYEMSGYLNEHGIQCVTAYSKGPDCENTYRIGNAKDTKIHGLLSRLSGKQAYFSKKATKDLLSYMDGYEPDIVILRNLHGNFIHFPLLMNYLKEKDIATVAVLHDCWFFTGRCCHYTAAGCDKWQSECKNCPQLKKYNKSWFFDKSKTMHNDKKELFGFIPNLAVVAVSQWLCNEAKKAPVFSGAKEITYIYNWIDTNLFRPSDTRELRETLGLDDKKVLLAVAAAWSSEKGLDTVKKISEGLKEDQRLVVIGRLPEGVSLGDKAINIPPTDTVEELVDYYSMADVFIQPSLEETFGKVSAEALSCGTPLVAFDSTANPELVGDGCGMVSSVGDTDGMIENINKILADGKSAYSSKCRAFAEEHFDMVKNLEKYTDLFTRLLG
ncbi:MAG: glycosyltransferase [Clostridiales bacterium]|nr:glycosyltransferase [Clostridiales bacterium]